MTDFLFDKLGYLVGHEVIIASYIEVEVAFTNNQHRLAIWQQFSDLRKWLIEQKIPVISIWIDGSFVSGKPLPNDIDLVV